MGGLLVLALSVALVAPYFIDWTSYRADFEREASRILGREVTVEGAASARLLPFPSVTFADVTVAGGPDGAPAVHVDTFGMDAELAPFLRGEILIFDMRLERPVMTIALDANGHIDWPARDDSGFPGGQVTLENISVADGEVRLLHGLSGREHRISDIDARVSAQTLAGPWRLDGTGSIDGVATSLAISTGTYTDGSMRVRVRASPSGSLFQVETDGAVTVSGEKAVYSGQFRSELAAAESGNGQGQQSPGHRVSGQFEMDADRLEISEFTYQTGPAEDPYVASGHGSLDFGAEPRFLVVADGAQIRLDEADEAGTASFETRLATVERVLGALPRPTIPGTVEVNLPALVAGDTMIRDLRLNAEPADTGWQVNDLRATLPGRSTIEARGSLVTQGELGFSGELLLAVNQPSGFAAWLARDVDDTVRRLPPGGFSANVALSRERQSFRELELALGGAVFRGEIDSATPADMRPSLRVALDGDRLDLPAMQAFASLFVDREGAARLEERDVDIDLKAGPVEFDGLVAGTLDTAVRLRDGQVEVDRLAITDLAGANVSATASLRGLGSEPSGHIDASVIAVDLAPLVADLSRRLPQSVILAGLAERADLYPGLLEDTRIDVVASALPGEGGTFTAEGEFGGSTFQANLTTPRTNRLLTELPIEANVSLRNDEPAALYALAGLPGLPLGFVGPAEVTARVSGELYREAATSLRLRGDGLDALFDGTVRLGPKGPELVGSTALVADDLSGWLATAGVSLPAMTAGLPLDLRAGFDFQDGLTVLSGLGGSALDQAVNGDLNVEMRDGRPHVSGSLDVPEIDLDWLASLVLGEDATADAEHPFAASASDLFAANISLSALRATIGPEVLRDVNGEIRYGSDGLRLNDMTAQFAGGALRGFAELSNNGGTGLLSAQFSLSDASLADALGQPALDGRFDFSSVVAASGRTLGSMANALSGTASLTVPQITVEGLDGGAFPALIAEADRIGRDIDEARTAGFAPDIISQGRFEATPGQVALSIAGGQLRAPPISLSGADADLTVDLRADLSEGRVFVDALMAYDAGNEELVGSSPSVRILLDGPPSNPSVRFDTQPLAQFLIQRALEIEQARVEAMQAGLLEGQRLRRENRYYAALESARLQRIEERRREEAEAWLRAEAARNAREAAEAEEARRAAEDERQRAEEAARPNTDRLRFDVEEFLRQNETLESIEQPTPEVPPSDPFQPGNLTIEGLLGNDAPPFQMQP
ncbi:AsmA family protein [Aliihoeflea sp. PC F10.4]